MKILLSLIGFLVLSACTSMKVVEVDKRTGYFPSGGKANVTKSEVVDLDKFKGLLLAPNGDFTNNMVRNIGYFNQVITFEDLEKIIIKENLTDQVPSLSDRIGVSKAANAYQHFLWLRWDTRKDGNKVYQELVLTDPVTQEDLFVCETLLDYMWKGVNDQSNWYPMMNALIEYIKSNSKTF